MAKSKLKSDVIISYVSLIVSILISFLLVRYQLKFLGKDQYGVISLINSVIWYIVILDLGIGQTVTRYVTIYKDKGDKTQIERIAGYSFKNYIKIAAAGTVIGIVIILISPYVFKSLKSEQVYIFQQCFFISLMNAVLQIPGATFNAILMAYKEFSFIRVITIIKNALRLIIMLVLLKLGYGLIMVFVVDLILNQLVNILCYLQMRFGLKIKMDFKPIDEDIRKTLASYSFFVFLGIMADQIFWKTDSILLGVMSSITVVGIYNISAQLVNQYMMICGTFSSVFLPQLTEMINKKDSKKHINEFFTKASRYQFILVAMILINYIFLGKQFIILWVTNDMVDAYYYGLVIFISLTVPMFQTTGCQILYAMNKHKARSIILLINAIANLVMSVVLFKFFGAMGPALATAIAMVIGNTIMMNIYYSRVLDLKLIKFFKEVCLKISIVSVVVSFIYLLMNYEISSNTLITFIIKAIIGNSIYMIGIYLFALSKEDKDRLIKKIRRNKQ